MSEEPGISYLKEMLRELASRNVLFVVAGGVAAVLHGVERTTMDLDIALEMSPENVRRFADAMSHLGLEPLVPVPVEALSDPEMVRLMVEEKHAIVFMLSDQRMPLRKVDVFLTERLSYESLEPYSVPVALSGISVRVVDIDHLLALKRDIDPPRDKDVFDIRSLERISRGGRSDD